MDTEHGRDVQQYSQYGPLGWSARETALHAARSSIR
jgi:hypothetical protein